MPELPEVETVRRGLAPHVIGRQIATVVVREARLRWPVPASLPADLPEAINIDLSKLEKGATLTLKDIALPKGVEPVLHGHTAEDTVLVSVVMPAAEEPEAPAADAAAAPAADADKK